MIHQIILLTVIALPSVSAAIALLPEQEKPVIQASSRGDATPLTIGTPIEREMKGGEAHTYRVGIVSGHYLRVVVGQQGIDVIVTLIDPNGQKVLEVDSPNGSSGPEPLSTIAEAPGEHFIEVRSANKAAKAGRYEITMEALRVPAESDRNRVTAESKFREARMLSREQAATSRRQAIEKYEEALPVFRALGDRAMESLTLNMAGLLYHSFGELQKAMDCYSQALPVSRAIGDAIREAVLLNNIGGVYDILGEPHKALAYYSQALSLWQSLDLKDRQSNTLNNIGVIYLNLGELQKALEYYNQALPLRQAGSNRRLEADTLDNLGHLYILLGQHQRALDHLQQALELRRSTKDLQGEGNTLQKIGFAHALSGDMEKAKQYNIEALPLWKTAGDRRGESFSLRAIGVAHSASGNYEKALEYLEQALQLQKSIEDQREQAITLGSIGDVYTLSGRQQKAMEHYTQSLALFRAIDDRRGQATVLQGLARVERERGDFIAARNYIEEAISKTEAMRGQLDIQWRASYLGVKHDAYQFYVDLLMRMHRLNPSEGHNATALKISERARARSLLEQLSEARVDIRHGVDVALLERERNLARLLNAKAQRQIQLLGQKNAQAQLASLSKEISGLEEQYQQAQAAIRKASPQYAALTEPQPLTAREIQQLLDEDTLLLEYSMGDERSYLWAVTKDSIKSYELPEREVIKKAARQVYDLLTARSRSVKGETAAQKRERVARADEQLPQTAAELSEMVIGPAAAELSGKRLVIVPDGELHYIPFAVLASPIANQAGDAKGIINGKRQAASNTYRPLVADNEIISLPSASAFAEHRKSLAGRKPADRAIAVIADPVFSASDERLKSRAAGQKTAQSDLIDNSRVLEHAAENNLVIARLPFTRREAEEILSIAPSSSNFKALDFKASLSSAVSPELAKYRYVHFATHGYLNTEQPDSSGIVLSMVDERGQPQPGMLMMREIYNLKLPAELVVLSACETGLGKEFRGEGLWGLTRGFMYAGAARVVVSLWNVNDRATSELMAKFYERMLKRGERPAAALRAAQVEMWRQREWQSPYYWAAFTLQGEWR